LAALAVLAALALLPAAGAGAVTLSPGDVVVTDTANVGFPGNRVIRIDPVDGVPTPISVGGSLSAPLGVALEEDGDILVADTNAFGGSGGVIRIDPATGTQTMVSSGGSFVDPSGIAIEPDGDVLVADINAGEPGGVSGAVIRVDPATGAQTTVSSGARS
jgi:streptogramin lyase